MGRFKTSLELFKHSVSVIAKNKALLLFPVIALIFIFLIILFFISPFVLSNTGYALTTPSHWKALGDRISILVENKDMASCAIGFAWLAVIYLVSVFSTTFFNVAFYNEILHALNGNGVSIARGIRTARLKIKPILIWSMFAGIVGIIIKTLDKILMILEDRPGFIGQLIIGSIGITWGLASIFIIPVIIREEKTTNPLKLLKTSAGILRTKWGGSIIGFIGIGGFGFLIVLLLSICLLSIINAVLMTLTAGNTLGLIAFLSLILINVLIFYFIWNVIEQIFQCSLYIYATEGIVPGPFDEEMMNICWKVKGASK